MIYLISFGHHHGPAPQADRVEDVRRRFRDPARAAGILDLDGFHPDVQAIVMDTPGVGTLLDNLAEYCLNAVGDIHVAVGCAGGRHRAPALVEMLGRRFEDMDVDVDVDHRDVHLPRVLT